MTTPADVRTDEEAFAACLAGRPVPAGAQGLAAFTDAVRSSATAPGRPNAALAELLATGLLVPTQEPSRGTAGRPARTSRKRPQMLISTLVAKFAAAGAVAKAAAGTGAVVVALTGAATTGALTSTEEPATVVESTTEPTAEPTAEPTGDPTTAAPPAVRSDRSPWNWLLFLPILVPLLTPLFNHDSPRVLGFPMFYWLQLAFIALGVACTGVVYQMTKRRR